MTFCFIVFPFLIQLGAHLCSAVSKGALNEVISSLLNESVHLFINSVNEKGKTPLFLAAKKGNTDILMELLHCPSINPNCVNLDGKNAVYGIERKKERIFQFKNEGQKERKEIYDNRIIAILN